MQSIAQGPQLRLVRIASPPRNAWRIVTRNAWRIVSSHRRSICAPPGRPPERTDFSLGLPPLSPLDFRAEGSAIHDRAGRSPRAPLAEKWVAGRAARLARRRARFASWAPRVRCRGAAQNRLWRARSLGSRTAAERNGSTAPLRSHGTADNAGKRTVNRHRGARLDACDLARILRQNSTLCSSKKSS
jgi:hypothetical protein